MHSLFIRENLLTKTRHVKLHSLSVRKEQTISLTGLVEKMQIHLQYINFIDKRMCGNSVNILPILKY